MNLILFLTIIVISIIVVRIGAIALNLTGMEWTQSKFQALSCFTGTGFTTKESELVTGSPRRRRIASYLIVLGHAGLVTMIATFANSIRPELTISQLSLPFLRDFIPAHLLPLINLLIIIAVVYALHRMLASNRLAKKLTNSLREKIIKREIIEPVSFEELLLGPEGYGVSRIEVGAFSPLADKSLSQLELRKYDISVLVVSREGRAIPNPPADAKILAGDSLLCFGKLVVMRNKIYMLPDVPAT